MSILGLSEEEARETPKEHENSYEQVETLSSTQIRKGATVVSLHSQKQVKVILCECKEYADAQAIADHMKSRRPVVLNLHGAPYEEALRILDFMSGTTYALGGRMEKLGQNVFLCAPENVEIQGSISEWLQVASTQNENATQTGR